MKKVILTTAILTALLISCNEKHQKHEATEASEMVQEQKETRMAAESISFNNNWVNEIKLNNGSKWEANLETTQGVDKMLGLIKINDPLTVEDYQDLASKLNDEKILVIKECTMKGPSHDNLHVFLQPLIEKIDALLQVSTTDEGSRIIASINENLEEYTNYFK